MGSQEMLIYLSLLHRMTQYDGRMLARWKYGLVNHSMRKCTGDTDTADIEKAGVMRAQAYSIRTLEELGLLGIAASAQPSNAPG